MRALDGVIVCVDIHDRMAERTVIRASLTDKVSYGSILNNKGITLRTDLTALFMITL